MKTQSSPQATAKAKRALAPPSASFYNLLLQSSPRQPPRHPSWNHRSKANPMPYIEPSEQALSSVSRVSNGRTEEGAQLCGSRPEDWRNQRPSATKRTLLPWVRWVEEAKKESQLGHHRHHQKKKNLQKRGRIRKIRFAILFIIIIIISVLHFSVRCLWYPLRERLL